MLQWGEEEELGKRLNWLCWTQGDGEHVTHMAKLGFFGFCVANEAQSVTHTRWRRRQLRQKGV